MVIIDENYNICNISKHVDRVKGLKTGSSPTDAWIITFKPNVFYKNIKIKKAFLKIYSNLSFFDYKKYSEFNTKYLEKAVQGLTYETNVYKYIITPLVDYNICPNFIRMIGSGTLCKYDDLFQILKNNYYSNDKTVSVEKIRKRLNRSITNNILNYEHDNISFDESVKASIDTKFELDDLIFDVNLTETYDDTISFHSLLNSDYVQDLNIFNILFQIFVACYSMSLSKMVHNDLHTGNIMIRQLKKPKILTYIIEGNKYILKVYYFVHIYDFDRAYVQQLGDNKVLNLYDVYSQNNEYVDNKDVLKLLCSVYKYTQNSMYLKCLTDNKQHFTKLVELYDLDKKCNFQLKKYKPVDSSFFDNYNDTSTIIKCLSEYLPKIEESYIDRENFFVCQRSFFNENGELDKKTAENTRMKYLSMFKNNAKILKSSLRSIKKNKISSKKISRSRKLKL